MLIVQEKLPPLLGLRLLTAMTRQGLTIPKLARKADVHLSAVQKVLAGTSKQPSVWTIWRLALALNLSLDDLTGLSEYLATATPEGPHGDA